MPQDTVQVTRGCRAMTLPTLIFHYPLVSAAESDSGNLSSASSPPQSSTGSSDSPSIEAELSPLSLSLSSQSNNVPEAPRSESATELNTPTSVQSYSEFNENSNLN